MARNEKGEHLKRCSNEEQTLDKVVSLLRFETLAIAHTVVVSITS